MCIRDRGDALEALPLDVRAAHHFHTAFGREEHLVLFGAEVADTHLHHLSLIHI
mgnify:CR=1 FL=1